MPLRVVALPEPVLAFGQGQTAEDPRTGLALFGPHDATERGRLQIGVIGTRDGLALYRRWVSRIAAPILPHDRSAARPAFPGYAALTGTTWPDEPAVAVTLARDTIDEAAEIPDRHQRIFRMADIFSEAILDELQRSEVSPDLWFVIIPDAVWLHGRPRSGARRGSASNPFDMTPKLARTLRGRPSLFPADNAAALVYQHSPDFHHQLKARLLDRQVPIQIMKEGTLLNGIDEADPRTQAAIAWNLSSSTYYKSGGRPWKSATARDGVCYLGIVFKEDPSDPEGRAACCAAQMFIDSGDGFVFRSNARPWRAHRRGEFHLPEPDARSLMETALAEYRRLRGEAPREVFVHGRVRLWDEEWAGFRSAAGVETAVTGVTIRESWGTKLFREGDMVPMRGLAVVSSDRDALLWSRGYVPYLDTYAGRELPNPFDVSVTRGEADIETVLADVLSLTKLNYNACIHADGEPVTLKFANAVGEILTAAPRTSQPPMPFKYYI